MRQLYNSWADYVLSTCHILMYQNPAVIDEDGNFDPKLRDLCW